ncbi:GntR family transcriptional regulator [Aeromicrobium sp. Root472D3]|uniref:GntR family transcriptional regulator n=1 Tax=Aeromicrobium sp. Root472D3 TaxID=1736540 RepID=UPI0006FA6441|nr:GntR family transcriptional regulator [Aeromicrobium sp. Root472D3]KQX74504.1 hypothetical protein ASD10_04515 [Aeromicrobium sp. Root472D3]
MSSLDIAVRRTTAAQQVAEGLSDLIMSGHFSPGTRLRESAIATDLKISRNTVREAVRILELGGLVNYEVNRGAVVIAPTAESVMGLYDARLQLETAAVHEPRRPEDLGDLRKALNALTRAADTHRVKDIVTADLAFHASIVALLGNSRINDFYNELTTELRYYLTVLSKETREYDDPSTIVSEHAGILAAIESGDPKAAAEAIFTHVNHNAHRVCDILVAREAGS